MSSSSQSSSPNPHALAFRPAPIRAATTLSAGYPYKSRAASQPAGERIPAPDSQSSSVRESPGNGYGGAFGVIGGSRTPGPTGISLASLGTTTRANSFSAGEFREHGDNRNSSRERLSRTLSSHVEEQHLSHSNSPSPYPTFSPTSTPSTSPPDLFNPSLAPGAHSPPKAGLNVSRSRSHSLAAGVRHGPERGFMMPMSTLENTGAFSKMEQGWNIPPPDASNTSPFTRGMPTLGGNNEQGYRNGISQPPQHRLRSPTDSFGGGRGGAWGSSAPETATAPASALSSSVANALGGYNQPGSTIIGGFGDAANGGKSGSSSRRHSISVVGGPGGRRDFTFGEPGQGMSSVVSPPGRGLGPLGFSDVELLPEKLENALSLEIDESRRRGVEIEAGRGAGTNVFQASSLPKFDHHGEIHHRTNTSLRERDSAFVHDAPFGAMATSPGRGRAQQPGFIDERDSSGERKSSGERSRFSFDNSTSMLRPNDSGPTYALATPERGREVHAVNIGGLRGPGPIGGPAAFDARALTQPFGGPGGPLASHVQQAAIYPPSRPTGFPANILGAGPPSPVLSTHAAFGRTASGYAGYYGSAQLGSRPPTGGPYLNGSHFSPPGAQPTYQPSYSPPAPGSPNNPTSPSSFSSLSLADLGKGLPLTSLAPNTPLYVVTFKAGRRDVYYCPDPTLLISNGDRVIVEADRGSDLGIVVYDQLTPVEVREWQEKQATAALLSGASQHQPPGMVNASATIMAKPRGSSAGELGSTDLHTLLSGVGPSGQLDIGQTQARGPLAKEVMPKRIFARSSQGPEEQARMMEKMKDEYEAMMICREKVVQRGLPMQIVDAEYQWDRRKLTFYFKADKRVDFRDLTKENFRIFKSRIWMSMVPKDDPRV